MDPRRERGTTTAGRRPTRGRVWFPRVGQVARPAAALLGLPLSTYTAALIANTAVPVWHESHRLLPFVYGSGAALSAGGRVPPPSLRRPTPRRRAAWRSPRALLEVGAKELMHHQLGEQGEPYKQGAGARSTGTSAGPAIWPAPRS